MAKNPSPSPMTDCTNNDAGHNSGFDTKGCARGQTMIVAYGNDRSTMAGDAQMERSTPRTMGGGIDDLSHSLGTKANQKGM